MKTDRNINDKKNLPELLAPCGSPDALTAAVKAGADAVYLGGEEFNARINAHNFSNDELIEAIKQCHASGVRVYVTFNTLIYDREFYDAMKYAEFLYKNQVDALIVADMGLSVQIKKYLPDFELHASTQLSGHNSCAAQYLAENGFSRMVCARELSAENIKKLIADSPIEIEMFIHGAMCVSHSGQCLMSSVIGNRSGNRGLCAQPCRMKYNDKYPLSLKDMCLAAHITDIIDMGIASLKIEGRMKSPDYVFGVTNTYRRLLDEGRNASEAEQRHLAELFSRGGFTDGYFTGKIGMHMLGVRSDKDKAATKMIETKQNGTVQRAYKRYQTPIRESVRKYVLPAEEISYKNLRSENVPMHRTATARFFDPAQIPTQAKDYFDIIYIPLEKIAEDKKMLANGVVLPPVITDSELSKVKLGLSEAKRRGIKHLLVGNVGHIALAKASGDFALHGDYRLNITNSFTAEFFTGEFEDMLLSPELTFPQLRDIKTAKAVISYGRLPLMLCEKSIGAAVLSDRTGAKFPIIHEAGRDIVLNSVEIYMADRNKLFEQYGIKATHYIFTTENCRQVETIINAYKKFEPSKNKNIKRIRA